MHVEHFIRPGMLVIGSDERLIGTIGRLVISPDGEQVWITVEENGLTVPSSLIRAVRTAGVVLELPKDSLVGREWVQPDASFPAASEYAWRGGGYGPESAPGLTGVNDSTLDK